MANADYLHFRHGPINFELVEKISVKINVAMARHPVHSKSVIGLGIKRYFHLRDMLNFIRGGILKLHIVNPCPL